MKIFAADDSCSEVPEHPPINDAATPASTPTRPKDALLRRAPPRTVVKPQEYQTSR